MFPSWGEYAGDLKHKMAKATKELDAGGNCSLIIKNYVPQRHMSNEHPLYFLIVSIVKDLRNYTSLPLDKIVES